MSTTASTALGRLCPVGALVVLATLGSAGFAPSGAQTAALGGGRDLTVPPELREGMAPPAPVPMRSQPSGSGHERGPRRRSAAVRNEAGNTTSAPARAPPAAEPPVDVGVTLRGGSGTPRVYGQTGTSQPIQESGSAFGAAMKFGF